MAETPRPVEAASARSCRITADPVAVPDTRDATSLGGQLLLHLISLVYERASIVVTAKLAFGKWPNDRYYFLGDTPTH